MREVVSADRADRAALRDALVEMVIRYGAANHCLGMVPPGPGATFDGKTWRQWLDTSTRRFQAVQRLAAALRDAGVPGDVRGV